MRKNKVQKGQKLTKNYVFAGTPDTQQPTCINMAVPHGMDGMLAFTSMLAKELGGQGLGC